MRIHGFNGLGLAILTSMKCPNNLLPFMAFRAAWASAAEENVTKTNPLPEL